MFYNIPYVIIEHWSRYLPTVDTYKGVLRKFLTKLVVKKADALLVISENLRKAMKLHHLENKNSSTINNVVDTDIFKPLSSEQNTKLSVTISVKAGFTKIGSQSTTVKVQK